MREDYSAMRPKKPRTEYRPPYYPDRSRRERSPMGRYGPPPPRRESNGSYHDYMRDYRRPPMPPMPFHAPPPPYPPYYDRPPHPDYAPPRSSRDKIPSSYERSVDDFLRRTSHRRLSRSRSPIGRSYRR